MLICPKCRTTYSSSLVGACYRDGEKLVEHDAFMAAERDPLRGRDIAGKYHVLERIGVGGMGTVYKASQAALRRNVAVKILKPELTSDPDTVARFSREATAMSLLTHANTTRVYDFGQTEDGLLYLVMELLDGELLTQRMARVTPMPLLEAVQTAQQILRSLAEAHTKGVVHRDLKPDNIFVATIDGHGQPVIKVLDFGIAKIVTPDRPVDQFETQAGTVFGTPRYMSPEQAQGAPLDQRSDLYSVGAMLYQMLTGRAPFTDDDAVVVMAKHIREMPDAPRVAAPDRAIPERLERVVMRALAKEPDARFQTASELEAALEACVADVIAAETASGRPIKRSSAVRRNLTWGLAAFTLAAASYAGLRVLAKNGEPVPTVAHVRATLSDAAFEPAPLATTSVPTAPDALVQQEVDEDVRPAEGPEPAVVAIRSEPTGALVYRGEERLGETPISLLVKPHEEFVRIELRLDGYQPLAAELTAKDGERLLKLSKAATVARATRNARNHDGPSSRGESHPHRVGRDETEPAEEPSTAKPAGTGPYERFE